MSRIEIQIKSRFATLVVAGLRRSLRQVSDTLSPARIGGDVHPKMLALLAAAGRADFQLELVEAAEAFGRTIDGDKDRHFGGQALLEVGGLEHTALDGDRAMRRRTGEPNRWQRTGGAIRTDAGEDTDTHVTTRRRLQFA